MLAAGLIAGGCAVIPTVLTGCGGPERESADVVIIGGGNAGLAAAVAAAEKGADVVVLDKGSGIGLNMHSDRGLFASSSGPDGRPTPGDSVDRHFADTVRSAGDAEIELPLVRAMIEAAPDTLRWLAAMGMNFEPEPIYSSSLWTRCWQPVHTGYVETLYREAKRRGVRILFGQRFESLTLSEGRVTGVTVRDAEEKQIIWSARRGVVLAAGGFAANLELVAKYAPELRGLATDNQPGARGDALLAAMAAGADVIGLGNIQCVPRPPGRIQTQGYLHLDAARFIYVDSTGKRFVNEDSPRDRLLEAFMRDAKPPVFEVGDNATVLSSQMDIQKDLWKGIEDGTVFKGGSPADLARKIGVPPAALEETIESYNREVADPSSASSASSGALKLMPLRDPPFWAVHVEMHVHETLGGLHIRADGAVYRRGGEGEVIPGLWAAGAIIGGLHGKCRLGGNGLASAVTVGRIAGASAAEARP
ncbi:FAD-dependent oxidoreductase [Sutterella sp.]|uniref:FAD-dependent oxidoreductase n=1 Tax=Sutterella sp. TaxID=1981025 RepID=UPI0026DEF8FD|nr:FAD-dependent oxidoreductase [Sutterella sp.]MDO5531224.1 FAD-dependent oxidoreductase [Sutterella sp.]